MRIKDEYNGSVLGKPGCLQLEDLYVLALAPVAKHSRMYQIILGYLHLSPDGLMQMQSPEQLLVSAASLPQPADVIAEYWTADPDASAPYLGSTAQSDQQPARHYSLSSTWDQPSYNSNISAGTPIAGLPLNPSSFDGLTLHESLQNFITNSRRSTAFTAEPEVLTSTIPELFPFTHDLSQDCVVSEGPIAYPSS